MNESTTDPAAAPEERVIKRRPGRTNVTKRKVFLAALELIREGGMEAMRVDDVASRAGVAKGSVYYNFGSKDEMVVALIQFGIDELDQYIADHAPLDAASPLEAMVNVIDSSFQYLAAYPAFAQLWISEAWHTEPGPLTDKLHVIRHQVVGLLDAGLAGVAPHVSQQERMGAALSLFGSIFMLSLDIAGPGISLVDRETLRKARVSACMLTVQGLIGYDRSLAAPQR